MADLVLDWSLLGPYGTPLDDNSGAVSATVETGGVEVDVSFDGEGAGAAAFTFNAEGYVEGGEDFDPNSHLKLFGESSEDGVAETSTTTLDFRASDTDLYTDQVQNVSFRLNDVDVGATGDEGDPGAGWEDIVEVRAFDAEGNPVDVSLTPGAEVDEFGDSVTGGDTGTYTDADNSVLVEIAGPVASIEIVYSNGDTAAQRVLVSDIEFSTVDVTDANLPPVAGDDTATTDEDTAVTIDVLTNDSDPEGGALTVTGATADTGSVVVNGDGTLTYTPADDYNGPAEITYTIEDPEGNEATGTVDVTVGAVNDDPEAAPDAGTTPEDTPITLDPSANDTDPDGDPLTTTAVGTPTNGTAVLNGDGTVTYTPDDGFTGDDTIPYTVSDGEGGTDTGEIVITVTPGDNEAPTAVPDATSTPLDTPVTLDPSDNDTDPDGDPLTTTAVGTPLNGSAVLNGDGTVTYTPDDGFVGDDTIPYTVSDGEGGTDTGEIVVTVGGDNTAPTAVDDLDTTPMDTAVIIDVVGNDTDPESDPLVPTSVTDPVNGSAVINGDGTVTYTPDAGFTGVDTFDYIVSDGNGGTDTATVTVTVTSDDAPDADDDSATTPEGTPVQIYVQGNDSDPDGDTLTTVSATDPANGSVTVNADNTITYTPDDGFSGVDTFDYVIEDSDGNPASATVTVTVSDGVNDTPDAEDDVQPTDVNTPTTVAVLENDTDPDGDPLVVTIADAPDNGTAVVNDDGTITYTPTTDFEGVDTLTYTITDPDGAADTATVRIEVGDVANEAPEATDDADTTPVDTPIIISVQGNDTDPNGDSLTTTSVTDPDNGAAVINGDGTVTYTPDAGFTGTDTFTYTITDPDGETDTATVTVTVTDDDDNEDPVANPDTGTTEEGTPVVLDPVDNDTDPDGDTPVVTGVGTPTNGTAVLNDDGTVTYTPDDDFTGDDTIPYTISDGEGGTDTGEIVVTVTPERVTGDIDTDIFPVSPDLQPVDPFNGLDEDDDPTDDLDDVNGTSAGDSISTGDDADTITSGAGDDTVNPGIDDDLVSLGGGDDSLTDPQGSDTVLGGDGNDTIIVGVDTFSDYEGDDDFFPFLGFDSDPNPDDGRDSVEGNNGNDFIQTGDDADTIEGGQGDDTVDAGIDDDFVQGNRGNDSLLGGHGSDTMDGGQDDDYIDASAPDDLTLVDDVDVNTENDRDSVIGGLGNDTLITGDDDDTLLGGSGNDLLDGGIDEDSLNGGNDDDTLLGGAGDDTLYGGAGNDSIDGGADADTIIVSSPTEGANDTVQGGSEGDDNDTLDMSLVGVRGEDWRIVDEVEDSDGNGIDGTVEFLNASGAVTGTMDFFNIETVVPCFTPGTLIATPQGERLVEDLQVGDRVITRDNGIQEIRWTGRKDLTGIDLARKPHMKPVLIQKGALGNNLPEHDMLVSPNHRVLVANDKTALYFEEREVLVAAKHLTGLEGVDDVEANGVAYIHFMFEQHEVVLSNGAWTESFQPGDYTLRGIGNAQRQEIFELFPELEHAEGLQAYGSARRSLKKHEAALLTK